MVDTSSSNTLQNPIQDPVRYWPSGAPQILSIIGAAALAYRACPGSPIIKATAATAALGVSGSLHIFIQAVENPEGFNRLMYSIITYRNTGVWPARVPNNPADAEAQVSQALNQNNNNNLISNNTSSSIFPDIDFNQFNYDGIINYIRQCIPESIVQFFMDFFRPQIVEGYLDDLIGQQYFIQLLLFVVSILLLLSFVLLTFHYLVYSNRDFILNKFNNNFIKLYFKYQLFFSRINIYVLPIVLLVGLTESVVVNYYLITHPIPYDLIPQDLHIYIKK
uniref:hypothetical protein n=1 Tax=Dichomitus squalens TaxID=114155 RepID=UPI0030033D6B|nr:hypothetical protein [Dichomitus squalens]